MSDNFEKPRPDREAMARIIDPTAFADAARYPLGTRDHAIAVAKANGALAKADAILAILPAEPVQEMREGERHQKDCGLLYDDGTEECTCREHLSPREKALEEALRGFADQPTIAEAVAGPDKPEWLGATPERRIEMMGERRRAHDERILAARALLEGKQCHEI